MRRKALAYLKKYDDNQNDCDSSSNLKNGTAKALPSPVHAFNSAISAQSI